MLVISNRFPYPILDGADLRKYYLTRALAAKHSVTLVCQPTEPPADNDLAHMQSFLDEVTLFVRKPEPRAEPPRTLGRQISELFGDPAEYFVPYPIYDDVLKYIRDSVRSGGYDGVLVYGFSMRKYGEGIDTIPVVYDICDVPSVFLRRLIPHKHGIANKLRGLKEWWMMKRFEKRELGKLGEILLVSSEDAKVFRAECPQVNVTVIPNGVDAEFFRSGRTEPVRNHRLLFTGVMDYPPNVTAMTYFCKRIWPLVRAQVPDSQLQIVGRKPVPEVMELQEQYEGVEVTGAVDDIRDYFDTARVYVCSLQSGSGIKNKILESWAMELPVVATSLSCEGIEISPEKDILVADKPESFAEQVVRLLSDREICDKLARNGRRKVEERYSWDSRAMMLGGLFGELARQTDRPVTGK